MHVRNVKLNFCEFEELCFALFLDCGFRFPVSGFRISGFFKQGSRDDPNDFRDLSSIKLKGFERIVYDQLYYFLEISVGFSYYSFNCNGSTWNKAAIVYKSLHGVTPE